MSTYAISMNASKSKFADAMLHCYILHYHGASQWCFVAILVFLCQGRQEEEQSCASCRTKVRCFFERRLWTKLNKDDHHQGVLTSDPKTEARNSSTTSLVVWAFSQPEKVGELFLCILSDFEIFCLLQWRWVERRTDFMSSFPAELSRRGSCIRARWHSAGISAAGGRALKASLSPAY